MNIEEWLALCAQVHRIRRAEGWFLANVGLGAGLFIANGTTNSWITRLAGDYVIVAGIAWLVIVVQLARLMRRIPSLNQLANSEVDEPAPHHDRHDRHHRQKPDPGA